MAAFSRARRGVFPLVVGFVLLAIAVGSAVWLSARQEIAVGWVRHTLEVENRLNQIQLRVTEAETGQRGFLISGNVAYLAPYTHAVSQLPRALDDLEKAIADNPRQRAALAQLRPAVDAKVEELAGPIGLMRIGHGDDAEAIVRSGRGRELMIRIHSITDAMAAEEENLLRRRTHDADVFTFIARMLLVLSAGLVFLLAIVVIRDGRDRVRELEATNRQLADEISERSAAQSQVRQLQKMEAVGKLTGGIAHDFNNMLAVVIGSLDLAKRRLKGDEHPKLATLIESAHAGADRAATLTARLLAFSRQQPLEPKLVEVNKLVGGMSELVRRTLGENIQIETVLAGGLWTIWADATQIESALLNLAVNSRDAMPGGGKLTIETANSELDDRYAQTHDEVRPGQYVVLQVTDTGTGMSRDVADRAFEPFYTTKEVGRGTGLGLSQVFGFVKQSSGHLKIYSEEGRGTTVKMYLPRHFGDAVESAMVSEASEGLPAGSPTETILVVEDEHEVRRMSVAALNDLGYTVIEAGDATQALEILATNPRIDLLFTDIVMPGRTGRQLVDEVRQSMPDIKVLYTTGYTRNAIVHGGVVDADAALLQKPFSVGALARKVRDIIDG